MRDERYALCGLVDTGAGRRRGTGLKHNILPPAGGNLVAKRAKPMFAGFFAFWKRTRGRGVVRFEKRLWANVYRAWHGGTL